MTGNEQKEYKMNEKSSVICYGNKTFIISNNPYSMKVIERTPNDKTLERTYTSPRDISPIDKRDLLLVRAINNTRQRTK